MQGQRPPGSRGPATDFPYHDTKAALLLRQALDRVSREEGLSVRKLGKLLRYKQATVISHMAGGRVPIPLERAAEIAGAVGLDRAEFLVFALQQRVEDASDLLVPLLQGGRPHSGLCAELETIAGTPLDDLPEEHRQVLKEVVSDRSPRRRWLTLAELPTVSEIRRARPNFPERGLNQVDLSGVVGFLG